jgi:uncharacterized protein
MESKRSTWISRHQLLSFFILSYAITWSIALITMYMKSPPAHSVISFIMLLGPTFSAFIISALAGGMDGIKKLLAGFTRWKFGPIWYLATLSLTLIPLLVALVYILMGNHVDGIAPGTTVSFLLINLLFTLLFGPVAEETGWRGFALPRLQKKYSALLSSLILGVVWSCWHLPFYFISAGGVGIPFPIYVVLVTTITIFITWIYNNTKGNLVLCILAHFCFNFNSAFIAGFLGLLPPMVFYISCGAGLGLMILIVVLVFGQKNLSRSVKHEEVSIGTTI